MGWLGSWSYRVKITIDKDDIDSNLTWFPILIHLSSSCGIDSQDLTFIFDEIGANSKKIAITKSDGTTQLYVEVERWDSVNEEAWLWVSRTGWTISSTEDATIYIYYSNGHSDNDTYVGDSNSAVAENVWDDNFKFVSHMQDDPDNTKIRDSTSNNNDGTKKGADEPIVTTNGKIDDAQDFDANDDYIEINPHSDLDPTTALTFECWLKHNGDLLQQSSIFSSVNFNKGGFDVWKDNFKGLRIQGHFNGGSFTSWLNDNPILTKDVWWHIVVIYDSSLGTNNIKMYVNSVSRAVGNANQNNPLGSNINNPRIGRSYVGIPYCDGIIDEIRVTKNVTRSSAWIKASYEAGRDHLLTYGSEIDGFPNPPDDVSIEEINRPYGEIEEINRPYGELEKI